MKRWDINREIAGAEEGEKEEGRKKEKDTDIELTDENVS